MFWQHLCPSSHSNNIFQFPKYSFFFLIFIFFNSLPQMPAQLRSVPIPFYMDDMLSAGRKVYDKQSTPTQDIGLPTNVKLAMYIEGIGSFRTHTMDFQLDVYLQQFWRDPRLAHNESSRILIRDKAILDRIWHPDVYFANARIAQFHEVTQPNFLIWIDPDGSILYDTRVSMIVICAMNLKNFPLDSQWCHLRILSYAYDIHHLQIEWVENEPITKNMNITMSDMDIVKLIPGSCDGNYSTGVWSCVTAEFFVSRELTHHILQTYVPTTLIVVISWFSFWLDVEAVPARVSLAITTLLTLSTQANSVKNSLPEVSYMKSLDLFLAVSVLFVFGVLIEFTIVNYTQRNATFIFDDSTSAEQTTMAAAGLVEEKERTPKCSCMSIICKTLSRWFCHHKHLSLSDKSWSPPDDTPKLSPIRLSLLRNLSHQKWSKSPEKSRQNSGECNASVLDVEAGIGADGNNNNRQQSQNCLCTNRKGSAKKIMAKEHCTMPRISQLQHVSSIGSFGGSRGRGSANGPSQIAPIIVYEEEQDGRLAQQQSVDKREAARLAYWSRPELSCEGLSMVRANGNGGGFPNQQPPPFEPAQMPPMIVEPDVEPNRPPLAQQECGSSSTSSSPPSNVKRVAASSSFISSSQDYLNNGPNGNNSSTSRLLGPRPVSRRASAMASLLDPINIGSGDHRDSMVSTAGNVGSQQGGQSMTPQAKWRHAVRKLQMNKREAGRMQAKKIDAWSRWVFPLSYFSFHAAYWYYYLRVAA